jgi:hypothetical protein
LHKLHVFLVSVRRTSSGNSEEKQPVSEVFVLFGVHLNSVSGLCRIVIVVYLAVLISFIQLNPRFIYIDVMDENGTVIVDSL